MANINSPSTPTTPLAGAPPPANSAPTSPTTSSRLGTEPPSTAIVGHRESTDVVSHGASGLPNPFERREVNGKRWPMWKDTGRVPLIAIRAGNGHQPGEAFGLEPEAAERAINAKEAHIDGRAIALVGDVESVAQRAPQAVQRDSPLREVGHVRLSDGGALAPAGDGRDGQGHPLHDVGGAEPTYPGHGEPLIAASGPQPANPGPPDSHVNAHPESKSIPTPGNVGPDEDKPASEEKTTLTHEERRELAKEVKSEVAKEVAKDKIAESKANKPNETAPRGRSSGRDS